MYLYGVGLLWNDGYCFTLYLFINKTSTPPYEKDFISDDYVVKQWFFSKVGGKPFLTSLCPNVV